MVSVSHVFYRNHCHLTHFSKTLGPSKGNSIDSRRALGANTTANMSMLPEQGSFFGMSDASNEKLQKPRAEAEHEGEQSSIRPNRPISQLSSASRQLGLAPTVLDLGPVSPQLPAQTTDSTGNGSQHSKSLPMDSLDVQPMPPFQSNSALRADTGPSQKPGAVKSSLLASGGSTSNSTSGRLSSTTSAPADLIENMIKRLGPEKPHQDAGADFPIRRRRAQSKIVSVSITSIPTVVGQFRLLTLIFCVVGFYKIRQCVACQGRRTSEYYVQKRYWTYRNSTDS